MSNKLMLSAGSGRLDPAGIGSAIEELQRIQTSRIDMVLPINRVRVTSDGRMFFDVENKLYKVGGYSFVAHEEAWKKSEQMREEDMNSDWTIKTIDGPDGAMELTGTAKSQLLQYASVPVRHANAQAKRNNTDLLWNYVQETLQRDKSSVTVRMLDNQVRAVVSGQYKSIDSMAVLGETMDALKHIGADLMEVRVWEDKFQMTVVHPELRMSMMDLFGDMAGKGHVFHNLDTNSAVNALLEIENDEAGGGGLNLLIGLFTQACTNYVVLRKPILQIRHVGKEMKGSALEGLVLTANTRQLIAAADIAKMRDAVSATFTQERFKLLLEKYKEAATDEIPADKQEEAVKAVIVSSNIPRTELKTIYEELMASRNLTRYGLMQAVTQIPTKGRDASAAYACDRAGGDLLEFKGNFTNWINKNSKLYDNEEVDEGLLV